MNSLQLYYEKYLKEVRKNSASTIGKYTRAIKRIDKILRANGKIKETVFEVTDIYELAMLKEYLQKNAGFVKLDTTGHRMYSAALNNYYKFAIGEDFNNISNKLDILDAEVKVSESIETINKGYKRSSIIKVQTLEKANHLCEINNEHETFIPENSTKQYMEAHHIIPLKMQDKFKCGLDVYANVICLCPICHRFLHYGKKKEKAITLHKIYTNRVERLEHSGITLTEDRFMDLTI